jgi:hypothetical protein
VQKIFTAAMSILIALSISGCAVPKDWTATGGSRADGIIKLSYEYALFEVPKLNNTQGVNLASKRCKSWGYEEAEPFGGLITKCINYSSGGCNRWMVTADYQCLGNINESTQKAPGIVLSNKNNIYEELKQLQQLKLEGLLSEEEFQAQKMKVLNN